MTVEMRKFTNAFQREFELVSNYHAKLKGYVDPRSVIVTFNVNKPTDLDGEMDRFTKSLGAMSFEDSASQLSWVKDIPAFKDRYEKEKLANMDAFKFEAIDKVDKIDDDGGTE